MDRRSCLEALIYFNEKSRPSGGLPFKHLLSYIFALSNGGKPWNYVLIPHDVVAENMPLSGLVSQFTDNQFLSITSTLQNTCSKDNLCPC